MDIQSSGLGTASIRRTPEEEKRGLLAEHMTQEPKPTLRDSVLAQVAGGINDPATMQPNTLPINDRQWNLISRAASESEDPDAYLARYGAALTFSKEYGIPVDAALDNLDELASYLTGEPFKANKTGVQAIRDSFTAGRINMQYSDLAYKFKQADLKGEDTSAIMTQLEEYAGQIAALQDHQPRNIATTALKWTAEGALPYMIEVGKSSLMGATFAGALGTGFTAATGITLGSLAAASPYSLAAIISMGATVGAVNRTRELMEGVAYLQLRELGIDKDIANVGSRTIGMVVGAIEAGLGIEVGTVIKAVGGEQAVTTAASKATAKLVTSGKLGAFIQGALALGVNATDEALEEMSEEVAEYLVRHIAYAWQETRGPVDPMPEENLVHDTLKAGFMGFGSALVLGGPSALYDAGINIRQLASMRQAAQAVPSKEAFINSLKQARPESVEAADWTATMANLWEREHKGKDESSSIKSDQAAYDELDSGKGKIPTGTVRRLNSGRLYTAESENTTVDTSGAEHRRLLVGDPVSGARYGYVDYSVKGNDLVINDVMVRSGYESVRKEAVLDLLEKYPGYEVTWEAKGDALADVRQQIIDANPRGQEGGLQYRDGITDVDERLAIESQIERAMPNLSAPERSLAAILVQLRAESEGTSAQGWLDAHFKDGRIFGNSEVMGEAMQGKRGAVSFDQDLKAIIYAGENADFSTFAHETFHVMLRNLDRIEQFRQAVTEAAATEDFLTWLSEHAQIFADGQFAGMDAQQLSDVAATFSQDRWGRTQEEFAARLYEGYLADGKTASTRLQQLFQQIAQWMRKVYDSLRHTVDLDPRITEVFDSMLDKDSPLAAREQTEESTRQQTSAPLRNNSQFEVNEDRTIDMISTLSPGDKITVYDIHGNPLEVTVVAISETNGAFTARTEDGTEIRVDNYEYSVLELGSSDQSIVFNKKLRPVESMETAELEIALKWWERYTRHRSEARQAPQAFIRQLTAIREELKRRGVDVDADTALNILYQDRVIHDVIDGMEQGTLAVLHNISPEKLAAIDDIGGLPSPSLAITRPGIPFDEFGSVTLIADPAVARAALEEGRLYDRDVWSPTVPRAEWKINRRIIESFDKKIRAIGKELKGHLSTSETFYSSSFVNGLESLVSEYKNNLAARLTFLKERGYGYEAKYTNRDKLNYFPMEIMEAHKDYFLNNSLENDSYDAIREHLRPLLEEHFSKGVVDGQPLSAFRRNVRDGLTENALSFSSLDSAFTLAKKYDPTAMELDERATWLANKDAIASHDAEFTTWLKENLKDAYTDPKIKIGSKNYEYNAENILRWMRTQSETASQKTMTYGPEKAASNAGTPFSSRGDVRRAEGSLVTRDEQGAAWTERVQPLTERLQQELPQYNKKYSTWDSLDAIYKAIAKYITKNGSDKDTSKMRAELSAQGFTGVPKNLLQAAVDLASELVTLPQDYLEAKPDRIVSMDEFKAAVVPSTLPTEQRTMLESHGIQVIEYQNDSERTSLISDLYANERSDLLFQDGPPITEAVLEDARGMASWEEFMSFYQAFAFGDDVVPTDEAWYQQVFNEANRITVTEEIGQERLDAARRQLESEDAKDEYMKDKLSTDEGVVDFLGKLGYMLSSRTLYDTEGDPVFRETVEELQREAESLVHPTVLANAFRVKGGTRPTQRAIKSVRTLMTGDAIRYYRDVYALVMEDLELRPQVIDSRLPAISDPGINTLDNLSITERLRLANRIEATELKKALLSGKETIEGAAEKIIRDLDLQIRELGEKIFEQETALDEGAKKFNETERHLLNAYREQRDAKKLLDEQIARVRNLTEKGRKIPIEELKRTRTLQDKLQKLDDQVMAMREGMREKARQQHQAAMEAQRQKFKQKSADARTAATIKRQEAVAEQKRKSSEKAAEARLDATVKRHEALDRLKGQLTEKQKQKAEAQRVRKYKLDVARRIMARPSDAINWEQAVMIYELQAALDPAFRRESTLIDGADGQRRVSIDDARELFSGSSREEIISAIGQRMYEWIADERRPLNEWTIAELEDLAERVGNLRAEGRRILAAKVERQQAIARQYQESIIRTLIASGKYKDRPIVGSIDDQKEKASPFRTVKSLRYSTLPMRAKAMMLDGDTQGVAYNLLVTKKRQAQAVEWTAIEARQKPVIDFMKEIGLTERDLYETVGVSLDLNTSTRFTYSALMYAWLSQFDRDNRNAVAYGNLVTQSEKATLNHDDGMIMALGDERYRNLLQQAEYHLDADDGRYMQVLERVRADFNGQKDRINEVAIREFNRPMRNVDEYLPIHRREFSGQDMDRQIADDWFNQNAGGNPTGVTKGFTRDRIKISPKHQRPVNLDLMQVWNKSVRDQEHFVAFAEYGRELNRVFKNPASTDLKNVIDRTLGHEMVSDIHDHMNKVINPQRNIDQAGAQKAVRFMRGNLGAAYLTWKMSSLVLQTITSPAPFLQEVKPLYMAKGYIELFSHPLEAIAWINEKSPMMKNRTMNVIIDEILRQSRTYQQSKFAQGMYKMQEIGGMGLTLVDRYAVAGGWLGAYHQRMDALMEQGITGAQAERMAIDWADDITLKTQPTGDVTEIAPLFTSGGEWARAFMQFTTPLNVIWTNLTYDMPVSARAAMDKTAPTDARMAQFSRVMGTIVGYGLAGAVLGAVAEGYDDDDDEIDKLRKWIYWSTTQASESVPLFGQHVDSIVRTLVTGEKPDFFSDEFFPGMMKIFKGMGNLAQGDLVKALNNLGQGAGYMGGVPVSGIKQAIKTVKEGPGAMLGR